MAQREKIPLEQRLTFFDDQPGHLDLSLDGFLTNGAGTDKFPPQFEIHRDHEKRTTGRTPWPKALFWLGGSAGLVAAGLWALGSI